MSEKKILIVDDESAIRSLLRCAVAAPGFTVLEADCAKMALSLAADHGPFELVITDVVMPGMDGIELARHLWSADLGRRFLFISGYCDVQSMLRRFEDLPEAAFLGKPFSIPDLLTAVRRLLESQGGEVRTASIRHRDARTALRRPRGPRSDTT